MAIVVGGTEAEGGDEDPAASAELRSFLERLRESGAAGGGALFAVRGSRRGRLALRRRLRREGISVVPLCPPEPWCPLAPLQHLLALARVAPLEPLDEELEPEILWLGPNVVSARLFLRAALLLRGVHIFGRIDLDDLNAPVWGTLLHAVMLGKLHLPVTFVAEGDPGAEVPRGVGCLDLETSDLTASRRDGIPAEVPGRVRGAAPDRRTRLGKRDLCYLAQLRLLGTDVLAASGRRLTKMDHARTLARLGLADVLSSDQAVAWAKLRDLPRARLPRRPAWARAAVAALGSRQGPGEWRTNALWLMATRGVTPAGRQLTARDLLRAAVLLGAPGAAQLATTLTLHDAALDDRGRVACDLFNAIRGDREIEVADDPVCQVLRHVHSGDVDAMRRLETSVEAGKADLRNGLAAQAAVDLATWNIGYGRLPAALKLLRMIPETGHWVARWRANCALADAYTRMGRFDLSRNHLERALAAAPVPLSPVLQADLAVHVAHAADRQGDRHGSEVLFEEARDIYVAMEDGIRLGRLLLVRGELHWMRNEADLARAMFGRALRLAHHFGAGLLGREVELKLALLMRGAPFDMWAAGAGGEAAAAPRDHRRTVDREST